MRPANGNGHGGNGGGRTSSAVPPAQRPSTEAPPPLSPASPPTSSDAPELVIRFREALDYERSIAIFQRIQQVLKSHGGSSVVILELPRATGGVRRVPTSFRALPSRELAEAVANEVGGDVVEVVLPR
jgi:hypothetical protein